MLYVNHVMQVVVKRKVRVRQGHRTGCEVTK